MRASTLASAEFIKLSDNLVPVIAHEGKTHGTKEIEENGEKKRVCAVYGTVTCEEHETIDREVNSKFVSGRYGTPLVVILGPGGNVITQREGMMEVSTVKQLIDQALKTIPGEKIPRAEWKFANATLKEGDRLWDEKEYKKAIAEYKNVASMKIKSLKKKGDEALEDANGLGMAMIAQAVEEKDRKTLNVVAKQFRGLEASKAAKKALKELKKK